MPTGFVSDFRTFADVRASPHFGLALAVLLAFLVGIALICLVASAGGVDELPSQASSTDLAASSEAPWHAADRRPAPRVTPPPGDERIEALTGVVARKYRLAHAATRELVGAAFHEGRRNGLDPLLIIAVMAVESRFNPIAQSDGGAMGLMQVIPRYHPEKFASAAGESVLDPHTNIKLGARVLKEYIVRAGTEVAGLQLYNGASGDASNAYANKVIAERQRLQDAVRRARERA